MEPIQFITNILSNEFSMISKERLFNLYIQCQKFKDTDYSFVECGVARGGALALMKYSSGKNKVFGFDSFEGMPDITDKDIGDYNKSCIFTGFGKVGDNLSGGIENVFKTFKVLNVSTDNVHFVKGFFNDTVKINKDLCGKIAILRLDGDWYESTKVCLDELYEQVVDGGCIIIDDYGHWVGAKRATDEFREKHNITSPLIQTDYTEVYWFK
jgi:O-methyltransferase